MIEEHVQNSTAIESRRAWWNGILGGRLASHGTRSPLHPGHPKVGSPGEHVAQISKDMKEWSHQVIVPLRLFATPSKHWNEQGAGFPCFSREAEREMERTVLAMCEEPEYGYHVWLTPLFDTESLTLSNPISIENLQAVWPEDYLNPEIATLYCSKDFWKNISTIPRDELRQALYRMLVTDVPPEAVVDTMLASDDESNIFQTWPNKGFSENPIQFFTNFVEYVEGRTHAEVHHVALVYVGALGNLRIPSDAPPDFGARVIESMVVPFRDYLSAQSWEGELFGFNMWWDILRYSDLVKSSPDATLKSLKQILYLPHEHCQAAALHGLNHLAPDGEREVIIDSWLTSKVASANLKEYAARCKTGKAM